MGVDETKMYVGGCKMKQNVCLMGVNETKCMFDGSK